MRRTPLIALLAFAGAAHAQDAPLPDLDAAIAFRAAAYPSLCEQANAEAAGADYRGEAFEIEEPGEDGGRPSRYVLYLLPCQRGAYNAVSIALLGTEYDGIVPLAFAEPELDIDYADDASERLRSMRVDGFTTSGQLVNPVFDAEARTMETFSKWRGLGDAQSSGLWRFEGGRFVLERYSVDPTFDGEIDPVVVYER